MSRPRIVVFARAPRPGRAKTRLIPALGALEAARLQDAMTRHTLDQVALWTATRDDVEAEVRYTPEPADVVRQRYGDRWKYVPQGDGDLGARLSRAAADGLAGAGGPILILGSDCPGVTAGLLAQALAALARHDVVLGPALDGGYYLIGLRRPLPGLFEGIDWSTPAVLQQTRAAAKAAGASCALLQSLGDIDTPDDLLRAARFVAPSPPPYEPSRIAITGANGLLGGQFLEGLLETLPDMHVTALVRAASVPSSCFARLLERHRRRITLLDADLRCLVLTDAQRHTLVEADGGLWHFAASTVLHATSAADRATIRDINDAGTARLLDLSAHSDRPGPYFHLSTAYVCGRRSGIVAEHEHDAGATFRNEYERSKHSAETRVRAAMGRGLRGAIFRPSLVVSESMGHEPGNLVGLLAGAIEAASRNGRRLTLHVPHGAGINAVPARWVARALWALAPFQFASRTYHLTAAQQLSIDCVADAARDAGVHVRLSLEPTPHGLRGLDRRVDRALRPFRPYFDAQAGFDRLNLDLDAPTLCNAAELDVPALLRTQEIGGPP